MLRMVAAGLIALFLWVWVGPAVSWAWEQAEPPASTAWNWIVDTHRKYID